MTTTTNASNIRPGDTITCPRDGHPEKVTTSHRSTAERWFIRTTRHDHLLRHRHPLQVHETRQLRNATP